MTGSDGKVAIVTGGGSGLGQANASRGVQVVLSDIRLDAARTCRHRDQPVRVGKLQRWDIVNDTMAVVR